MKGKEILKAYEKDIMEDPIEVIDNALDIQLIVDPRDNTLMGFDICLGYGGPNIYWTYSRGVSRLEYYYLPEKEILLVDAKYAEQVLEYLADIYGYEY